MTLSNTQRAALWVLLALLCFSSMAVSGRMAGATIPTAELLSWRSIIGLATVLVLLAISPAGYKQVKTKKIGLHLIRNCFHFFGQFGWYLALLIIPLAELFAIEFTAPIWLALLAPFFLGERFSKLRLMAIMLGFAGVLIVVRPDGSALGYGQLWALASAVGFALNMLCTKKLSGTETALCILFYLTLMQLPMGIITAGGLPRIPEDLTAWIGVLGLSFGGLGAHYGMAKAFSLADASIVAPLDFFRLPLIAIVGVLMYQEQLDVWVFIGGFVIFLGNYINIRGQKTAG